MLHSTIILTIAKLTEVNHPDHTLVNLSLSKFTTLPISFRSTGKAEPRQCRNMFQLIFIHDLNLIQGLHILAFLTLLLNEQINRTQAELMNYKVNLVEQWSKPQSILESSRTSMPIQMYRICHCMTYTSRGCKLTILYTIDQFANDTIGKSDSY